jgi:Uma2 family endonuclease
MTVATEQITAKQLWRMPKDGVRHELVRGQLTTMAPSGFEHGAVIINLSTLLANHVKKRRLGVVVGAETGFILTRDPDTVRGVDIGFVRASRIPKEGPPKQFWTGAPDLAVEVLSPDDRPGEVSRKVNDYIASSAAMVWVVNPKNRTVTVHQPMTEPQVFRNGQTLTAGKVVPGFKCKVSEIFT